MVNQASTPGAAGGLTKEMFTVFFAAVTSGECDLFEFDTDAEHPTFLPAAAPDGEGEDPALGMFEAVGRVMAKAILDGVPVPARFHPCLFRALLRGANFEPNLHELETFSPTEARSCRQLLATDDVDMLYLTFEETDGGEDVTAENVKRYVRRRAYHSLVGNRRGRLDAMKRGFEDIPLGAHLRLFSVFELMTLVCGKQDISGEDLLDKVVFRHFSSRSQTPGHLRQLLSEMTSEQRSRFLSFVTASTSLPSRGGEITISFVSWANDRLPLAHTCFNRLDLPEYDNFDMLKRKLTWCLDNLEMAGFGEA